MNRLYKLQQGQYTGEEHMILNALWQAIKSVLVSICKYIDIRVTLKPVK